MNLIKQVAIIFGCLSFGELIVFLTNIKIPSSIIGLLFLFVLLQKRIVKVDDISSIGGFLMKNMGFFFVPPCIAMLNYFNIIGQYILPILVTTVLSTIIVAMSTGFSHQYLRKRK